MEATPEQSAEGFAIVQVLSTVLDRLVVANATIARADPGQVTKFHAMKAPGISVLQYLERIHNNNFLLTELNVHRVVITAVLLAAKFFDDAYYNNAYYAKVGGVLVSEMNGLEVDFLFRINFSLHVTPEVFEKYRGELLAQSSTVHGAVAALAAAQYASAPTQIAVANPQQPPPFTTITADTSKLLAQQQTMAAVQQSHNPLHPPLGQQITPSPPQQAAVQDPTHGFYYVDEGFRPFQRANSLPEPPTVHTIGADANLTFGTTTSGVVQRCAQASFSAPAPLQPYANFVNATMVAAPDAGVATDPHHLVVAAMTNQLLQDGGGVVHHHHHHHHHHHGMYVQQKDPRLQPC